MLALALLFHQTEMYINETKIRKQGCFTAVQNSNINNTVQNRNLEAQGIT